MPDDVDEKAAAVVNALGAFFAEVMIRALSGREITNEPDRLTDSGERLRNALAALARAAKSPLGVPTRARASARRPEAPSPPPR